MTPNNEKDFLKLVNELNFICRRKKLKILEDIYKENTAIIRLDKFSEKIPIQKGIRQGDTISHKLFTAVLKKYFQELGKQGGRNSDIWKISI